MRNWAIAAAAILMLASCGRLTGAPPQASSADGGDHDAADGECTVSSDGRKICPKKGQRYLEWDTYAIGRDGRTVTVSFTAPPARCLNVDELSAEVLPTEVHLTLSVLDQSNSCDERVARDASVTLTEPVAGRPVYSGVATGGGGMSSRGYAGSVEGPQCLGPGKPVPRADVSDCPAPTSAPPPIETAVSEDAGNGESVPWTAVAVSDHGRRLRLQWVSTKCARLAGVDLTDDRRKPRALLITVREARCKGPAVTRATDVTLREPLGRRVIIDATQAMR